MVAPQRLGSTSSSRFSRSSPGSASCKFARDFRISSAREDIPDHEEVAAEEDEASAVAAVRLTGFSQRLEGLRDQGNDALHLADMLHTRQ
jgi:hypothetical protein